MSAYLIVNFSVDDPDRYKRYQKGAGAALDIGSSCKLVAIDQDTHSLEGVPGVKTVILEFENKPAAQDAYDSEAYQAILSDRLGATSNHFAVIVDLL